MLTTVYHMLRDGTYYEDLDPQHFARRNPAIAAARLSILSALFLGLCWTVVRAAEVPLRYIGTWSATECQLPKSESDVGEFPYLVVTRRGYEGHEVSCTLKSVSKGHAPNGDTLTFLCSSEGEQSTFKEVWRLTQKQLGIWGWTFTETNLIRRGGEYGEGTYRKCALSAAPRRLP
jgi:hypothetical protein